MQTITFVLVKFHLIIFQPVEILLNLGSVMDFCYVYLLMCITQIEEACKKNPIWANSRQGNKEETAMRTAQEWRRKPVFPNKVEILYYLCVCVCVCVCEVTI